MLNEERVTEKELILPALFLISLRNGITTSDLISELENLLQPSGEDTKILEGRKDTKFSQKVRNLVSHRTLTQLGYATYERVPGNGLHEITKEGQEYLEENIDLIEYLLSNNFKYEDIKQSFDNAETAIEKGKKIVTFDENLMITEGARRNKNVALYERSRKLRDIAITHYSKEGRINCSACNFDFYDFYGEIGRGYIEIHHLKPVFQYGDEDKDKFIGRALENLMPTCSNCHRIIHRNRQFPLDVSELVEHINRNGIFKR
ncbi:MAG: HNH endonuclease [Candidatus Omnitrophota bacterium]